MSGTSDLERISASVYLLRRGSAADALAALTASAVSVHPLKDAVPGGQFFVLPADPVEPKWLNPVSALLGDGGANIQGQSPGAILCVPHGGRTFLLPFGYGHTKIKDEWVEPEFGKIVALCVVPQASVREMRSEQVFARRHIASERAPRAAAVREFGFEADRDLVAAVEGTPEPAYSLTFGARVRGGLALKLDLCFDRLLDSLRDILARFESNDHEQRWPQANTLAPVRDDVEIQLLDVFLDAELLRPRPEDRIALAAPSERSGDKPYPHHFVVGRLSKNPATSPYLTFSEWLRLLGRQSETACTGTARLTKVHLLDEEKEEIGICSMYQCLGAEVNKSGKTYVLSSGNWFMANQQFIDQTEALLAAVDAPPYELSAWNQADHEGPYNAGACKADSNLWLFDKELVSFGGGHSRFEFCDIMHHPSKTLYFVKHPAGSAGVWLRSLPSPHLPCASGQRQKTKI